MINFTDLKIGQTVWVRSQWSGSLTPCAVKIIKREPLYVRVESVEGDFGPCRDVTDQCDFYESKREVLEDLLYLARCRLKIAQEDVDALTKTLATAQP